MRGVTNGVLRKHPSSHDSPSQRFSGFRDIKGRQAADDRESLLHLRWIADRGFVDDDLRDRALKLATPIRPPFLCRLLVARDNYVMAGTSDQVADERSFQLDRFHADPSRSPAVPCSAWFAEVQGNPAPPGQELGAGPAPCPAYSIGGIRHRCPLRF